MEFEPRVTVWSNSERRKVSEFDAFPDSSETRLALVSGTNPVLIAGAYYRYGVGAYDALTGSVLWERKDLKKVQNIGCSGSTGLASIAIQDGAMHILDLETGETIRKFRDASAAYFASRRDEVLLTGWKDSVRMASLSTGRTICRYPVSCGSMHTAQNEESVVLTDGGYVEILDWDDIRPVRPGSLLCYSRNGKLLWQVEAAEGSHFIRVAWCPGHQLWYAVEYAYFTGGPSTLKVFDKSGELHSSRIIDDLPENEFFSEGKFLITSRGRVLSLPNLEVLWTLSP